MSEKCSLINLNPFLDLLHLVHVVNDLLMKAGESDIFCTLGSIISWTLATLVNNIMHRGTPSQMDSSKFKNKQVWLEIQTFWKLFYTTI